MNEMERAMLEEAERALPPLEGEVRAPGLDGPVEILRDRWGVPHVYASSLHDVFFAQGYLIASERMFQLEFLGRLGTGRLAELFSELAVPIDRFVRTLGWNRLGVRMAEAYDERSMQMIRAFDAGARFWRDTMPAKPVEYQVLDADPWAPDPDEVAAVGAAGAAFMAWSLSRAWDNDLLRAEVAERAGLETMRALFPDLGTEPTAVQVAKDGTPDGLALLAQAVLPPSGQGSNNWVVAGSRSATGKPLLANDPHLMVQVPSVWYEVHLHAPGYHVAGVALPFSPGVVIGHNDRVAWGFTNVEGDNQDLYLERLSEDRSRAEYLGGWEPVAVHHEEIHVRGRDEPEVLEVRETRHGPIVTSYMLGVADPVVMEGGIGHTYALRWAGFEDTIQPSTLFALNTASNWEDFRRAAAEWLAPGQNMVYADVDGNIGYQCTGRYPIRRKGDGTLPAPGWTDEYEWLGWIPFDELPRAFNPADGYLVTANNKLHGERYPYLIGRDFLPPFRARRIAQLLTETAVHDRHSFARIQMDTVSLPASRLVPLLSRIEPGDDRQKQALSLLDEWDHDLAADSPAAAIYEVWNVRIAKAILLPILGDELFTHFYGRREWTNGFQYQVLPSILEFPTARWFGRDGGEARDEVLRGALDAALDELTRALGDDMAAWRWGALHRVRFAGRLAIIAVLADLFTAGEVPIGGDEQTILQSLYEPGWSYDAVVVPSWRQILDVSDWDASVGTHTVGQSGNPASPHFADMVGLWSRGEHHTLPFSRRAVEAAAEHTLTLVPAD